MAKELLSTQKFDGQFFKKENNEFAQLKEDSSKIDEIIQEIYITIFKGNSAFTNGINLSVKETIDLNTKMAKLIKHSNNCKQNI